MRISGALAGLLLLSAWHFAFSQQSSQPAETRLEVTQPADMSAKECGGCHDSQYKTWTTAKHFKRGVVCAVCHGAFHSGSLNGCTGCHTGQHKLHYTDWEFVKDYMVEGDNSNYYCITCHDPHNPVKEKVLLCNGCHGPTTANMQPRKTFFVSLQKTHDMMARIAPEMDEDKWNRRMKSTSGKLLFGGGAALIGGLLIFPYFYTGFSFIRWLKKRRKK
jgi:hypothetical protein